MIITYEDKMKSAERELKQRLYVYPRRVAAGKMSKPLADREIEIMRAIAADYAKLAQTERLL